MEEEGKPAALVLLRRDQPLGQPLPLGLALARLREQARVLDRAGGEVGEDGRAHVVPAVERLRARQLEVAEPLAVDRERDDHPLAAGPSLVASGASVCRKR